MGMGHQLHDVDLTGQFPVHVHLVHLLLVNYFHSDLTVHNNKCDNR